jgi:hypothetical protein
MARFARQSFVAGIGVFLATTATAEDFTNDRGGSVDFYGQFSPVYRFFDDGAESYSDFADNDRSNSRLGFNLDQDIDGNRLRFKFEVAIGFPETNEFNQEGDDPFWEWQTTNLRKAEISYSGDSFGAIHIGQGSMATDSAAAADLSGTSIAGSRDIASDAGGFNFRDDDDDLTGVELEDVFDDLDGSRRVRLRYDTPKFASDALQVSLAYGTNELSEGDEDIYYDIALTYAQRIGDLEMEGAIGYAWRDRDEGDTDENWVGSFALLHTPTGLNFAVAGGGEEDGGQYGYLKLGYRADFFDIGSTNFSVDYYSATDFDSDGTESDAWGLQVVQKWDDIGLEGFVAYRSYSLDDDTGIDYADPSSTAIGARWRF